jgi:hypothetical protein
VDTPRNRVPPFLDGTLNVHKTGASPVPLVNYFAVLLPNRHLMTRLSHLETTVIGRVEGEFGKYMEGFEGKRIRQAIQQFVERADASPLVNLIMRSPNQKMTEADYAAIIARLQTGVDIDSQHLDLINLALVDTDSAVCTNYFRQIIENDEDTRTDFAIRFFSQSDIRLGMNYLEKVLTARKDFGVVLVKLFDKLFDDYLGDPFNDKRSTRSVEIGTQKVLALLNSRRIVDTYDLTEFPDWFFMSTSFLENENLTNWYPFLEDTAFYKKHYKRQG